MEIKDTTILYKIIQLQSCIIQGRDINAMLHKEKDFYQKHTQADLIAVYVNENENVQLEYTLEDHHTLHDLAKKYLFSNNHLQWEKFTKNCHEHFLLGKKYHHTNDFYELFKGLISKKKALAFSEELNLKDVVTMPIYDFDGKQEIGYICFMFQKKVNIQIDKLNEVKVLFETFLQPLHNSHYNFLYTKCVRIDEKYKLLTEHEKRIVGHVLKGKTYPEVSEILNISINTIKTHMKNIFNKYNVKSKIELYNKLNGKVK